MAIQGLLEYRANCSDAKLTVIFDEGDPQYFIPVEQRQQNLVDLCSVNGFHFIKGAPSQDKLQKALSACRLSSELREAVIAADCVMTLSPSVALYELHRKTLEIFKNNRLYLGYRGADDSWFKKYVQTHPVPYNEGLVSEEEFFAYYPHLSGAQADVHIDVMLAALRPHIIIDHARLEYLFEKVKLNGMPGSNILKSITPQGWGLLSALIEEILEHGTVEAKKNLEDHMKAKTEII